MTVPHQGEALEVPQYIRTVLVHAYAQLVADEVGVDILHVKGASVDPRLRERERISLDVDILVRPSQVSTMVTALCNHDWVKMTGFEEGSAFGHAMNLRHDIGLIDLHRSWPGFDVPPQEAFEALWSRRQVARLGEVSCATPSLADQRLILLLHYGRSGGQRQEDQRAGWTEATDEERLDVRHLVQEFQAHVAFAAATGGLEAYRDEPEYRLWKFFASGGGTRFEEWSGRWQAARGFRERLRVLHGFLFVNHDLLVLELGHEPTARERVAAQVERIRIARRDARRIVQQTWRRRRSQ